MCGIAGIVGRLDETNRAALRRMSAAVGHRGPDGAGTWESAPDAAGHGCLLAHRRLSILDLSDAAAQPMTDPVTGQTITYNGEIYNFAELRRGLEGTGERFHSTGDTAVLLRLLGRRGLGALGDARGMFALALWDPAARTLALARDPLGIKPLYVAVNPRPGEGWTCAFASEVRALIAADLLPRRLDPEAVAMLVWNGFVPGPATLLAGARSLPPGTTMTLRAGEPEPPPRRYWTIPRPADGAGQRPPAEVTELVRDTLLASVRAHLVSDVPVGVFLSGGVDSSAVALLAQQAAGAPVDTFTLAFDEAGLDEAAYARRVAAAIGARHHEARLTEDDFVADLDDAVAALDQPTKDALNTYVVARAVRRCGLKVALSGAGGDELFGGYRSFAFLPAAQRGARVARPVPEAVLRRVAGLPAAVAARRTRAVVPPQTRWARLPDLLATRGNLLAQYQLLYALVLPTLYDELLASAAPPPLGLPASLAADLAAESAGRSAIDAVGVLEQRVFLGERLLRDTDMASMAVALEVRLPLVDAMVADVVNRLPAGVRFPPVGRKALLRRAALAGLDPALFDRPKQGFELPLGAWLGTRLGARLDEVLSDRTLAARAGLDGAAVARFWRAHLDGAPGMHWTKVWTLYVLLRWCDAHRMTP